MTERYWDTRLEALPEADRRLVQHHRLVWQLRRCWDGSAFYRARLESAGLDPNVVTDPADLASLSPLRFEELIAECAAAPPFGRLTVAPPDWWEDADDDPERDRPVRVRTDGDVSHAADQAARALWAAGARPGSRFELDGTASSYPTLARALRSGAERIGLADRDSEPNADRERFRVWVGEGSDALATARRALGAAPQAIWLAGCCYEGGYDEGPLVSVGLPLVAPTPAYECEARTGLHWADDHFLVEVVDPGSLRARPVGEAGALLLTDLTREGSPLIRYWTGCETTIDDAPCPCGRTSVRSRFIRPLV